MKQIIIILLLLGHAVLGLSEEEKPWNVQETPEHIYRVLWIGYSAAGGAGEVVLHGLTPPPLGLSKPKTRTECRESAMDWVQGMYVDSYNFDVPYPGINVGSVADESISILFGDQAAGILGDRYGNGNYSFMRFICLPMDLIDDLDLVGTEYGDTQMASNVESRRRSHNESYEKGISSYTYEEFLKKYPEVDLILPDDDPRHHIRYDAARFFARFEQYGVTRTLPIPDIKVEDELHWNNEEWGTRVFIFPLDQSNE